jgi:hypothetical protein
MAINRSGYIMSIPLQVGLFPAEMGSHLIFCIFVYKKTYTKVQGSDMEGSVGQRTQESLSTPE